MVPMRGEDQAPRIESGQGMVEYALILALVALVVVAVLGLLGGAVTDFFTLLLNSF